jgi:hypothetical protein
MYEHAIEVRKIRGDDSPEVAWSFIHDGGSSLRTSGDDVRPGTPPELAEAPQGSIRPTLWTEVGEPPRERRADERRQPTDQ